jgi:uncharacterized protein
VSGTRNTNHPKPVLYPAPCFSRHLNVFCKIIVEKAIFVFKSLIMFLESYKGDIKILCQKNKVKSLYVFGSVLTDKFTEKSDIDLIVDIDSKDPLEYSDNYFNLKFALGELLSRQIYLLENLALKNPYLRENIDNSKKLLYAS